MSARGRPAVNRGKNAEREVAALIADATGWPVKRKVGEGQRIDTGDLIGVPDCTVQVVSRTSTTDLAAAIRSKPLACERQQAAAGTTFGVTLARVCPGLWLAVLTDAQEWQYFRELVGDSDGELVGWHSHPGVVGLFVATLPVWIDLHREAVA